MGKITPYQSSESKKFQVEKMFDRIAPKYDFLNHLLSLGIDRSWRRRLVRELIPANPLSILDIATGTGDLAIAALRKFDGCHVTAIDLSDKMLEIGKHKMKERNLSDRIDMSKGDAENLQFQDNTFDAVIVAFGVRNFDHLGLGLGEMHRVLKKGGIAGILEFSRPVLFPFKQIFNFYFRRILPWIGNWTSKDRRAYSYLHESVTAFPEGDQFCHHLEAAGFSDIHFRRMTFGVCSLYLGKKH